MPCRLLKAYNGQAANTVFWGSAAEEAPLLATGNADDQIELASDYAPNVRLVTAATANTTRYAMIYRMTAATAQTLTVTASGYWPVGTFLTVEQNGAGRTTIAASPSVNLIGGNYVTAGQNAIAQLEKMDATTWRVFGQVAAS